LPELPVVSGGEPAQEAPDALDALEWDSQEAAEWGRLDPFTESGGPEAWNGGTAETVEGAWYDGGAYSPDGEWVPGTADAHGEQCDGYKGGGHEGEAVESEPLGEQAMGETRELAPGGEEVEQLLLSKTEPHSLLVRQSSLSSGMAKLRKGTNMLHSRRFVPDKPVRL
jgi:hypothetical protein